MIRKKFSFICLVYICLWVLSMVFSSCDNGTNVQTNTFVVKDFKPITNWGDHTKTEKILDLDYHNAINGFEIPSVRQSEAGFEYNFYIKNTSSQTQIYNYIIYYQNESYKFSEHTSKSSTTENELAGENFYGTWENPQLGFIQTQAIPADGKFHKISGHIKIKGNPRNEERFLVNGNNPRWRRNPRVGKYSFMLVVSHPNNIEQKKIPEYIQNISLLHNGRFVNPYFYFLYGAGKSLENTVALKADNALKVVAKPDLGSGIYIDFKDNEAASKDFTDNCGRSEEIINNACFQQFLHYVDVSSKFKNIPVIRDVVNDDYTLMEYNWNKSFYREDELIKTWPKVASCACKNVESDRANKKLILTNPKSTYGNWKKENAGVITRHGFTYGTYTVKAKLTQLLSQSGMWNGIVNTIWLLNQSNEAWNQRRICQKEGYLETYWGGPNDKRVPSISYSEIDFEILKTVPYCPPHAFPPTYYPAKHDRKDVFSWHTPLPEDIEAQKSDIVVACTNWDMACWEPKNFAVGCHPIQYNGQTFYNHRWDHWYRAITQKSLENDKDVFGNDYYYFQIEWNPTEIIWRIGPEKDMLRVVGYVNNTVTSIPNNQMLLIITQEFHSTKWWPGTPFQQEYIPFPEKDIRGEILEIIIE